jgi:hypothetical protein
MNFDVHLHKIIGIGIFSLHQNPQSRSSLKLLHIDPLLTPYRSNRCEDLA